MSRQGAELTRRLDWRFLLPRATFRRAVLCGTGAALREHAGSLGLAADVDGSIDARQADLILLSPDDGLSAIEHLAPDGVVCCEVDRRRAPLLTPARLAGRLRAAGLQPLGTWAVRPGLARAESYVPIDDRWPLPWYLRTQYRAMTWPQRCLVSCVRGVVRGDGRRLAPLAPLYVMVAARPGVHAATDRAQGSCIVLTDSGDRAINLWFAPGEPEPRVVTKVPKSKAFAERTCHEQLAMVELHTRLDPEITCGLPQPLGFTPWGAVPASRESVVAGVTLGARCRAGRRHAAPAHRDLAAAGEWLARFHVATRNDAMDVADAVVGYCDDYLDRFPDPGANMVQDIRAKVFGLPSIQPVVRHPDFNVWNILRDGDRINVIDWEGAAPGPPLCDLVQFAVHWHESVTRRRPRMPDEAGLRALLGERSRAAAADAAVADVFNRYMHRLAIPDEWFDVLAVTAWIERALRRERQLVAAGSPRDERDRNNFGVRYVEALARGWYRPPLAAAHANVESH